MYLSLKLGIDPSCTQSNPHVPLLLRVGFNLSCTPHVPPSILHVPFIETGFRSLMYPSCTPFASPCTLHWDWGLISHVPLMYPLLISMYPFIETWFQFSMCPSCTPFLSPCTLPRDWVLILHVPLMYPSILYVPNCPRMSCCVSCLFFSHLTIIFSYVLLGWFTLFLFNRRMREKTWLSS